MWSPWRMGYIDSARDDEARGACCARFWRARSRRGDRVLARDERAFVRLANPYNPGHLLILPVRHAADPQELADEELVAIDHMVLRSLRALREAAGPQGFNVGLNLGRPAGAGIPEHLHWHVVPRWGGDTNFMPVIGQTRVLPELLEETFRKLRPHFGVA